MVEFALVLSLMLFVILGGAAIGQVIFNRSGMQHAVQQTAIAVAQENGCLGVGNRTAQFLGYIPDEVECSLVDGVIEIVITHRFKVLLPIVPEQIKVSAGAFMMTSPLPSPSPEGI
jgi:hypothetical protein